ncbi:hypothetical protein GQ43DRAFT_443692 [Delitschia confertaspora ATCC 74209]|uniref:Uncharacterized protein n=1 Tax=Delitschia confertaspora ATCC 74209 TaxID=1513339 RepID=A0A9P4JGV5_9PLEO|nr:hypothetical protein GQ43DRAFT_443692 [Delitschia confertaspora ATCC 74209]
MAQDTKTHVGMAEVEGDWDLCNEVSIRSLPETERINPEEEKLVLSFASHQATIPNKTTFSESAKKKSHLSYDSADNFNEQFSRLSTIPLPSSTGIQITGAKKKPPTSSQILKELGYTGSDPTSLPRSLHLAISNRLTREDLNRFHQDAELNFTSSLPYFFSGSFIFPSAVRAVTNATTLMGVARSMTPAVLKGYRRFKVRGAPWPAMAEELVPQPEEEGEIDSATLVEGSTASGNITPPQVCGMLLFGMLDSQRRALHRFENGMFDLRRAKVSFFLQDGEEAEIEAGVYVWNRGRNRLVPNEQQEWKVEDLVQSAWFGRVISRAEEEERTLEGVKV